MAIQSVPVLLAAGEVMRLSATMQDLANTPDDGYRYELLRGVLLRMPPPQEEHGQISALLIGSLIPYCRTLGMLKRLVADIGYELRGNDISPTVLAPDVSIIRTPKTAGTTYSSDAPLLAVEIASPSQGRPYLQDKAELYLAAGTVLVWVVWPESRTVDVWTQPGAPVTRSVGETLDGGTVLPGLTIPVGDLFP
ncbi:MAG: Uma2 family endonuclease [Ktedonobacterales bacterium]|nr:Uma2 family endonuclease [Ktedonobacterales bacterium]